MTVPGIVDDALGGEEVLARVSLSGDDELFVTPGRTLAYRAGGVLSDESVAEYPHDAERLRVREGRRKAAVVFEYAVEDDRKLSVAKGDLDSILQPLLASVLRETGATDSDERVQATFRFSELTVVVTGERLLKHVGSVLWDGEFESFHFEAVTDLAYEEGDVATGIVLTVDGRKERIKTPNDRVAAVRRALEDALFGYHGVDSAAELAPAADDEGGAEDDPGDAGTGSVTDFGGGVDPLTAEDDDREGGGGTADPEALLQSGSGGGAGTEADPGGDSATGDESAAAGANDRGSAASEGSDSAPADGADSSPADRNDATTDPDGGDATAGGDGEGAAGATTDTPFTESFDPAPEERYEELSAEVAELREAVERQNELLAKQRRAIERLVEELRN